MACIHSNSRGASLAVDPHTALPRPAHRGAWFKSFVLERSTYADDVLQLAGQAICKVLAEHCASTDIPIHDGNFKMSYETNIPRQSGLSGSSAIVCAALSCLLDFYGIADR